MTPVYHVNGCGGVAFSFVHEPYEGMPLDPDLVVYSDGSHPPRDTMALCEACWESLEVSDLTIKIRQE